MIAADAGGWIHSVGVAALEQDVVLGAREEERSGLCQAIEALKVEIAAVHHVEGSGFGCDLIEEVFTSSALPSVTRTNTGILPCRSSSVCSFTAPLRSRKRARKQGQAQIDGSGVERVSAVLEVLAEGFAGIELAGAGDEDLREVREDAPVVALVGVGESGAGTRPRMPM